MMFIRNRRYRLLMAVIVCGIGLSAGNGWTGETIAWKIGTVVPRGVGFATQIREVLEKGLFQSTGGEVKLIVYYGAIMGDEEDYLRKIQIDQLQGAGFSAQGTLLACPEMSVVALPFLFNSYDEVDYIKTRMMPVFDRLMARRGLKLILWLDQGFDQFYSTKVRLDCLENLPRARFITWYGILEERVFQSIGVTPVPVNIPEFNTTLRQGVADAYIGPAIWAVATQLYTKIKYMSSYDIRYSPGLFLVSQKAWSETPTAHREAIARDAGGWQERFCIASRQDAAKAIKALAGYPGIEEIGMENADFDLLRKKSLLVWDELADVLYPRTLLEEILRHLAEYRARGGG